MTRRLADSLRDAPATVPALAAVALFVAWATNQAGYPVTHWAPGGLILLVLVGLALGVVGLRVREIPVSVRVALGCLAAYTALSFLSILWAGVKADAWEGADRTLLYLLVFALFACWRQRGPTAALLVGVWVAAISGLAAFVLLHLNAASAAGLLRMLPSARLIYPSGYANANAAQWLMAFWPALLLARSARLHWSLRGLLAGACVLLAGVALLSQSRGSLYATPAMLVLVFVFLPGRARTFALLVPVAAGIGAATPAVLRVGDRLLDGGNAPAAMHAATVAIFAASIAVGLVVALGAAVESRMALQERSGTRVRRAVGAIALATLVAVLAGGWLAVGDPVARIRHGWDTFKNGRTEEVAHGNRLTSGLGSSRYDLYRVALDELLAHPLLGIGADNFQEQYLLHGRSKETPHYPHSVEFRTLAETGLVGTLLALVGLGAALLAGARAIRKSDPVGRAVAAAALGGFAYWVVHGSFDWFFEIAGLAAPAFALLGLACSLAPALPSPATRPTLAAVRLPARRYLGIGAIALVAIAAAASLAAPWLSQLETEDAARVWTTAPQTAYARLSKAAELDPLSDEAYLVAGNIALRYGQLASADHYFALALARTHGEAYATLERGAIASALGRRSAALELLERAVRLDPRYALAKQTLHQVRRGGRVDIEVLNHSILLEAQELV
jgi:tetratricopeptide (TPR) repeat protein